ncbi:TetR/AcrR family transcriptional regulator [Aneurinibacillus sp. REN35]|uniref:TetR/AcrR family transcriptional regulator n=1 Tax=Aneurinibacillus sp. REN35 TaxID=3237286 RepID=UPI003529CD26
MPKKIDLEERKKTIAEATWRVISKKGMEGATVRNIAEEAGVSLGALRHYFSTQEELLMYAMNLVKEKAAARIYERVAHDVPPKEKIVNVLLEIVPVNDETRAEMEVWFSFVAYFKHKQDVFDAQHDGIFALMRKLIDYLDQCEILSKTADKGIETERLYALVDGLALHAMLEPQRVNRECVARVLVHHINSLCVDAAAT